MEDLKPDDEDDSCSPAFFNSRITIIACLNDRGKYPLVNEVLKIVVMLGGARKVMASFRSHVGRG